jgi:hypothetical protein
VKVLDVGISLQEPQQFVNDAAQVEFLGGKAGESLRKVITVLAAKNGTGPRTRAVGTVHAIVHDIFQQV